MSAALPDPVDYAAEALAAAGALVERAGPGWLALLPPELARALDCAESCRLVERASETASAEELVCGIGSPVIDRVAGLAAGRCEAAAVELAVGPPRTSQFRLLAERFALRNAPIELVDLSPAPATYLVGWYAWSGEADDRYEGVIQSCVCVEDLGTPDAGFLALADPLCDAERFARSRAADDPASVERALSRSAARARAALDASIGSVRELLARRLRRDHERIADYFEQLARDARAPRRKIEAEAIAAKLAHLRAERDAKLRALADRFRLRIRLEPIALLLVRATTLRARLRVRRRKQVGEIALRLPPGAAAFDRLACSGCDAATARPLACDDRLHLLCEVCAPSAQGRPLCPACGIGR